MPKNRTSKPNVSHGTQPDNAPVAQTAPTFVVAQDFKTLYTNFVNGTFSPIDIFLIVGEAIGLGPDGKPIVLQRAKIIMSPAEAKIVTAIMVKTIAQYEKQFGKIVVAKGLMPPDVEGV